MSGHESGSMAAYREMFMDARARAVGEYRHDGSASRMQPFVAPLVSGNVASKRNKRSRDDERCWLFAAGFQSCRRWLRGCADVRRWHLHGRGLYSDGGDLTVLYDDG